jgi:hypothetical protein
VSTDYSTLAPAVAAKVAAGEITKHQANEARKAALVLVGFLAVESKRPETVAMFEANDGLRFVEGMSADPGLNARFVRYLAGLAA